MEISYDQTVAVLNRTPATLAALLRGLDPAWTTSGAGPDTWTATDVVGHLLIGDESDWIPRARIILSAGESRPFDTFDRTAMFARYHGRSLDDLLDAFARKRAESLAALAALDISPENLAATGTHPTFGRVTLGQLLATWTVHDLNHIGQVVEVMARQYAAAVGPWSAYLAILTRPILTE